MNYLDFLHATGRYDLRDKVTVTYHSRFVDTDPDAPDSDDRSGVTMTLNGNVSASCADYETVDANEIAAACELVRVYQYCTANRYDIPPMTLRTWNEPAFAALVKYMVKA